MRQNYLYFKHAMLLKIALSFFDTQSEIVPGSLIIFQTLKPGGLESDYHSFFWVADHILRKT